MLPLSLLKTAQNHPMLVELKNGETYNGHLVSCDNWMNINLREVICTSRDGDKFWRMPECYIRGSTIKYLRIPDEIIDMVKEEVVSKGRGRGGMQQNKQQGKGRGGGAGAGRESSAAALSDITGRRGPPPRCLAEMGLPVTHTLLLGVTLTMPEACMNTGRTGLGSSLKIRLEVHCSGLF
uniref:U6 snRNA-associated Sm-like protein LSm4 n=1 Tax=Salmo trutta TaxID=8032 RepID=A0A673WWD7_SALTR